MKDDGTHHQECVATIRAPLRPGTASRIQERASSIDCRARLLVDASHGEEIAFAPDGLRKGVIQVSLAEPTLVG